MSEPPPSPLAVRASRPLKGWYSNSPWRPCRGAHSAPRHWRGVRGTGPGARGSPRASTSTEAPACASRQATTEPPNPDPTTTTSKRSARIHLPGHRAPRVGVVGAERAGAHRRLELAPQSRVLVGDAPHLAAQRAGEVDTRPLGRRRGRPVAPAEADGRRQLVGDELHLLARPRRALGVVEGLGLLDLRAQVLQARAVLALGLRVEDRARVAVARAARRDVGVARHARPA